MNKEQQLEFLLDQGIISIVRTKEPGDLVEIAKAIEAGGVRVIEFTMTTPNAMDAIRQVASLFGDRILLGAGTVLDPETARAALLAGAEFLVAPNLNPAVVQLARRYGKIAIPGAMTPTEILAAWETSADLVKVFPATALGPQYIKEVLAPLPQVRLVPTGGVNLDNIGEYISAGASAVAVGSNLVGPRFIREQDWRGLTEKARLYVEAIKRARRNLGVGDFSPAKDAGSKGQPVM